MNIINGRTLRLKTAFQFWNKFLFLIIR